MTKVKKGDRVQNKGVRDWGTVSHVYPPSNDYPDGYFSVTWDDQDMNDIRDSVRWYNREVGPVLILAPQEEKKIVALSPVCTKCRTVYPDANHTENFVCWSCKKYPFYK